MEHEFQISARKIGDKYSPFIMAEVGINHEGDFDKAIQMVDAAAAAGVDCVKFQCHITEAEMIPSDIIPRGISDERQWDIIKRCELSEEQERRVLAHCEKKGLLYLCTPFSREAADRLEGMGIPAYKIGSGECNNIPLLEHIARFGKPMILSTGMNDMASIRKSVEVILSYDVPLMLMHCTSMYPTPYEYVRLGAINELREAFRLPVGLSDHSLGIYTCLGAAALGACALEKHFTLSRQWPGPDVPLSIEPDELSALVSGAKAIHAACGGSKGILPQEQPVIDFAYASVVSIRRIEKGGEFKPDNLWVKRPGGGIPADKLYEILGKRAGRRVEANVKLSIEDIAG